MRNGVFMGNVGAGQAYERGLLTPVLVNTVSGYFVKLWN